MGCYSLHLSTMVQSQSNQAKGKIISLHIQLSRSVDSDLLSAQRWLGLCFLVELASFQTWISVPVWEAFELADAASGRKRIASLSSGMRSFDDAGGWGRCDVYGRDYVVFR